MQRAVGLAKLTRPRLYRVVPRERLFERLDRARERPVVWISSPPGAGKTTLVSSYLEARGCPALWYQVDSGDADPASFFYYLSQAVPAGQAPLPLLTPEYLPDLAGFTRRFFRELYGRLPRPAAIVFDNYHEVPEASVLHAVFRDALAEVPEGVCIIVTSRSEPPAELVRLRLSQALARLDWEGMRITLAEASQLATLQQPQGGAADEARTRALWERSGGWAAGLVLILEHERTAEAPSLPAAAFLPESRQALFQYFASEILSHAAPEVRHLLLRTAYLTRITVSMAQLVSGDLEAAQHLEALYRQRYFIDRREEGGGVYQYHGLFREFLQARAQASLEPAERMLLQRRSARLLELDGRPEDAFPLHAATEDWPAATKMIVGLAPVLIGQGRWQTVKGWIGALPPQVVAGEPHLLHWLGACELSVNPADARRALEAAYDGYAAAGDAAGQTAAAAAIIESYYFEWSTFAPLNRWIAALADLLARQPAFASPGAELQVRSALLCAALYRQPQHPMLKAQPARVLALLEAEAPLPQRITAGTILLNYYCFLGSFDAAERVVGLLRPHLADPCATPVNQVWWRVALGYYRMLCADHAGAAGALDEAQRLARDNGLAFIQPAVLGQRALAALSFGDTEGARGLLDRFQALINPARRMDAAFMHLDRSWLELLLQRLPAAARHGQLALEMAFETGAVTIQTFCLTGKAQLLAMAGQYAEARTCAHGVRLRTAGVDSRLLEFHTLLIEAYAALHLGDDDEGLALLRAALALGRRQEYRNTLRWLPAMMSSLLARAIEEGIEPAYAAALVRARGLLPASPDSDAWPWPLRIHTLGRFAVAIDDVPLRAAGKAQAKPLKLLKAIVAAGGRDAAAAGLAAQLWPQAEGDAADRALDVTLFRLRKLLRHDKAVLVSQGRLSLNPVLVWVDAWAFERLADRAGHAHDAREAERLLQLYGGNFLDGDEDDAWALPMRDRLRSKFLRAVGSLGQRWEQAGCWEQAAHAYQRGLEVDNLSEQLYCQLMVCYQRQGRVAEAVEVYRRCRQVLSVVLGVKPSAATSALYQAIVAGDPDSEQARR